MSKTRRRGPRPLRICVCGLGYVGTVTAACLARLGHIVKGVDVIASKVEALNEGRAPFVEAGLSELVASMAATGRLSATMKTALAVHQSDMTLVCVGTPSREDGSLNSDFVLRVSAEIAKVLREIDGYHIVAIRSTVLPGMTRGEIVPILERISGKRAGLEFGVCFNPEFLREGTAIQDFFDPSRTVIGELDSRSGDLLATAYHGVSGPVLRISLATAEIVKYTDNWWHALKVAFANEVGAIAEAGGVDPREVMEIFALDTKLNLSAKYLQPGLPFGGSCLPKDLRALTHLARGHNLRLPLLEAVLPSNVAHSARILQVLRASGAKRVGILGLTFKPGTDDTRESPIVELIVALLEADVDVRVHDRNVNLAELVGTNRTLLVQRIPDLPDRLMANPEVVFQSVDVVIVAHDTKEYQALIGRYNGRVPIIDFARLC